MDVQEIKMFEKAVELQEKWVPAEGDWIVERSDKDIPLVLLKDVRGWGFITGRGWHEDDHFVQKDSIWLSTQEQLWNELRPITTESDAEMAKGFGDWVWSEGLITWPMNVLLLAFVYHIKWDKRWSGADWVAEP